MSTPASISPFETPFGNREDGQSGAPMRTLLEQTMDRLSCAIRQKPDWQKKINSPKIVAKWRAEAQLRDHEFDYVMSELAYLAKLGDNDIRVAPVRGTWESDTLIDHKLKVQLLEGVAKLEAVPEEKKDWHPNSNRQVLDLVHPSLYCLVSGVTKVTKEPIPLSSYKDSVGKGKIYTIPKPKVAPYCSPDDYYSISTKYQWLPTEFKVGFDGHVSIESYINNLDYDEHKSTYKALAGIFEKAVPMFNHVLTDLVNPRVSQVIVPDDWYQSMESYLEDKKAGNQPKITKQALSIGYYPETNIYEDGDFPFDDEYDEYNANKTIIMPDVKAFVPPSPPKQIVDLRGRTLQVIVKLANIELTPEHPHYDGGSWHVEGMENENIVASFIYYFHSENITESHLEFREAVCQPNYEQNDDRGVEAVYGLVNEGPLIQDLGSIITQEDRCIAFPNIHQHHVRSFDLIDRKKVGHRKILVFFLVDPNNRIISTANVPPQQTVMTLAEAEQYRVDLMKERSSFVKQNTEKYFSVPFSLCEH